MERRVAWSAGSSYDLELPMANLVITYQSPAVLKPRKSNPRTHSKAQLKQIVDSIRTFGFTNPVLVDTDNRLIAGHGRVEAAKQLGLERVPTVCLAGMTEAQIRAYVIADNRLAENAGWDAELLAIELQYLSDLDLDFEVTVTGFSMPEIDVLIGGLDAKPQQPDPADAVPEVAGPAVTKLGDIWQIGPHRLICGDATTLET
jgi:ParB-like chromosome segregation protein Spo0J